MFSTIFILVIVFALIFEFINGFHDTANAIATSVYTRALTPKRAILLAAIMNFIGALASEKVAKTITSGIVGIQLEMYVILAALIGAIIWNLITWWKAIPSSSSHALIGSLVGATMYFTMSTQDILWVGFVQKIIIPLFTSPLIGFVLAFFLMKFIFKLFSNFSYKKANSIFSKLQVVSAGFVAFAHGNNDAQKTMGIITLALISGGFLTNNDGIPLWVKIISATTMAAGTAIGGWKIMKAMGSGVTKLDPAGGFVAQTTAASVIQLMSFIGAPISTTQVITSSVMGVGSAKRISSVKWSTAQNILMTWLVTIPITMFLGATIVFIIQLFI